MHKYSGVYKGGNTEAATVQSKNIISSVVNEYIVCVCDYQRVGCEFICRPQHYIWHPYL